jgi:uncharacterized membrane protein YhaH (DUF805 family)
MSPLDTPPLPSTPRLRSYQGRFGRLSYIAWHAVLWWATCCIGFGLLVSLGLFNFATFSIESAAYLLPTVNNVFSLLFFVLYTYFAFVITIRRLHDINLSGWWSLVGFVPILNLFFYLYLLLKKGHPTSNIYAPVRLTPLWEKLLAWLCILCVLLFFVSFFMLIGFYDKNITLLPTEQIVEKGSEFF